MDKEQTDEWRTFSKSALEILEKVPRSIEADTLIKVRVSPCFEETTVWWLYKLSEKNDHFKLLRRMWLMDVDREKFRTPVVRLKHARVLVPSIEESEIQIDARRAEDVKERILALQISPWFESPCIGMDGVTFNISFGALFCSSSFTWWCDPPKHWQPMIDIVFNFLVESDLENKRLLGIDEPLNLD